MLTLRTKYKSIFAFVFFVLSSTGFADTNSVHCVFSPHLMCHDNHGSASTNKLRWENTRFTEARPIAVDENSLYISEDNRVFSFNRVSGKPQWQISTKTDVRYFFPVVESLHVYLSRSDGIIEKRLAKTGAIVWSKQLHKGWVYPPVILNGNVITGGQESKIWSLDQQSGSLLNTINIKQELVAPLALVNNQIIASTFDNQLSAYQLGTNKPLWQTTVKAAAFNLEIHKQEIIIASDMSGNITAIDNKTGKIRWQNQLHNNARFWNTAHKQIFISLSTSGLLKILDIDSGKLLKSLQFDGRFAQPTIVQGDVLSVFNTNGSIQRIHLGNLNKDQFAISY